MWNCPRMNTKEQERYRHWLGCLGFPAPPSPPWLTSYEHKASCRGYAESCEIVAQMALRSLSCFANHMSLGAEMPCVLSPTACDIKVSRTELLSDWYETN